ncbi:hypothetical protein [Endozoicomonas sp.]|uniref:hypothetical protein n=1 Tax=Endozoicomonas sp. TaxID=1892382 RepID=UPI002887AA33|nr:hypothetical protein [Endozoicomonas sp.]
MATFVANRRDNAKLAFMIYRGEVKAVYCIHSWFPAGSTTYTTRPEKDVNIDGRWEFTGSKAEDKIFNKYVGTDVSHHFNRGNSNPIFYLNCQEQTHNE